MRLPHLRSFGHPRFIQSPAFPEFMGACASNLFTLETRLGRRRQPGRALCVNQEGIPPWLGTKPHVDDMTAISNLR